MIEVKSISKEFDSGKAADTEIYSPSKRYDADDYKANKSNWGRNGFFTIWGLTAIGAVAYSDQMAETTLIPVVGPFITIARIESDPNYYYANGSPTLLAVSGVLQTIFAINWIYNSGKDSKPQPRYSFGIDPNPDRPTVFVSYRF